MISSDLITSVEGLELFRTANSQELQEDLTHSRLSDWEIKTSQHWEEQSDETEEKWQNDHCSASSWQSASCCLLEKNLEYWWKIVWKQNSDTQEWKENIVK